MTDFEKYMRDVVEPQNASLRPARDALYPSYLSGIVETLQASPHRAVIQDLAKARARIEAQAEELFLAMPAATDTVQ